VKALAHYRQYALSDDEAIAARQGKRLTIDPARLLTDGLVPEEPTTPDAAAMEGKSIAMSNGQVPEAEWVVLTRTEPAVMVGMAQQADDGRLQPRMIFPHDV
jgi:plasmid stability protein